MWAGNVFLNMYISLIFSYTLFTTSSGQLSPLEMLFAEHSFLFTWLSCKMELSLSFEFGLLLCHLHLLSVLKNSCCHFH